MTRWRCVQFCSEAGFKFAGTQYGRECFCENHAPSEEFLLKVTISIFRQVI